MSNRTYICRTCGGTRRKPAVYLTPKRPAEAGPACHDRAMEPLTNVEAAGAAKLRKADRLTWLAHGKRVVRRPGGRWAPVFTDGAAVKADRQRRDYKAERTPPKPRWVRPRRRRARPAS